MKLRRFSGISLRNLRARRQRTLLTAIGIVLGVGIVFGVITLSDTMSGTFRELYSRAFGAADITVTAAGDSGTFDEKVAEKVRGYEGVESAAPRLSLPASLILDRKQENGPPVVQSMRLFGVEPESAALATGFELTEGRGSDVQSTAWAIQAFVAAGARLPAKAFRYLISLRQPAGSFRYSRRYATTPVWVTAQALPALARKPFPLG